VNTVKTWRKKEARLKKKKTSQNLPQVQGRRGGGSPAGIGGEGGEIVPDCRERIIRMRTVRSGNKTPPKKKKYQGGARVKRTGKRNTLGTVAGKKIFGRTQKRKTNKGKAPK